LGIPIKIHVSSAAAHRERYVGDLPLKSLPRLTPLLADASGRLQVALEMRQQQGHVALTGTLTGELPLSCKRCGALFTWSLQAGVDWRLVADEAAERALIQECEPLLVENDELPLRETIEDEVLLALPMLPRCESCENAVLAQPQAAPQEIEAEPRRENPFAALKKQLKS